MAGNCRPPYPSDANDIPIQQIIDEVFKHILYAFKFRTDTLVKWLEVTREDVEKLQLKTIWPEDVREEGKLPKGGQSGIDRQMRQEAIRVYCETYGAPTARKMEEFLKSRGIPGGRMTISKEMNALGYKPIGSSHKRPHPSAATGQNSLPKMDK